MMGNNQKEIRRYLKSSQEVEFSGKHLQKYLFELNYSPLNILTDCLKWEIPKYRNLTVSSSLGYPRSSYG
jgi:hypothetical protein